MSVTVIFGFWFPLSSLFIRFARGHVYSVNLRLLWSGVKQGTLSEQSQAGMIGEGLHVGGREEVNPNKLSPSAAL